MKLIVLAIILTAFVLVAPAAAQSVVIMPKKVTYKRPKPIQDFKKDFTITYPKVKASTPALSKKIESTLSYAKVLKLDLKEELGEYQWLEEADYEVGYNKNGLLVITLSMNGTAAYPDGTSKTLVVDLKTGNQLKPVDLFTNLSGLTAMVKRAQEAEIIKATKEIKADAENGDVDPVELFEGANFSVSNLNEFAVDDKGVTFIYDYSFAHVIQALEPEGRYSVTWAQLKPYIKRGSLLAKFVR
jgi:hypothetical protein